MHIVKKLSAGRVKKRNGRKKKRQDQIKWRINKYFQVCREGPYIKDRGQFIKLSLAERGLADPTKENWGRLQ